MSDFVNGMLSGALEAALVQTPNQAIQVKMVHDQSPNGPKRYRSLVHAAREIHREFGFVNGFTGGMTPTILKVSLCNAIRFTGFGAISDRLRSRPGRPGGRRGAWRGRPLGLGHVLSNALCPLSTEHARQAARRSGRCWAVATVSSLPSRGAASVV